MLIQLIPVLSNSYTTTDRNNDKKINTHNSKGISAEPFNKVELYCLVYVRDTIEKFRRTLYWYPKHNNNKEIYVTHKLEDHKEWK